MGSRRRARELALQMLYQSEMSGNPPDQVVESFEDLQQARPAIRSFAIQVFKGTLVHMNEIDEMISRQAENWRLSRMAAVDRNIIRMSIYELLHESGTPKLVVIDEAIEIAKRFGTEKSPQFINGVLDGILKRYNLSEAER